MKYRAPLILNEPAIDALRCEPRFATNFWVQSFILTVDALKDEYRNSLEEEEDKAQTTIERLEFELAQARNQVHWFEETYNTRAYAPLKQRKSLALRCPHCGAREATKIGNDWCCFECDKRWEQEDRVEAPSSS